MSNWPTSELVYRAIRSIAAVYFLSFLSTKLHCHVACCCDNTWDTLHVSFEREQKISKMGQQKRVRGGIKSFNDVHQHNSVGLPFVSGTLFVGKAAILSAKTPGSCLLTPKKHLLPMRNGWRLPEIGLNSRSNSSNCWVSNITHFTIEMLAH